MDVIKELQKPLDASVVKQRDQAGRSLSYIESWWAISEANRIFGHLNWNRGTLEMNMVQCEQKGDKGLWYVSYIAKSIIHAHEVQREGMGFGQGIDRDLGKAHESAVKEAESDAMKRALMTFGNPFGLALYDKEQRNVASEPIKVDLPSARSVFTRKVYNDWVGIGGTLSQFEQLKTKLASIKFPTKATDLINHAMAEEGCTTVEEVHRWIASTHKELTHPFKLEDTTS